MPYVEDFPYCCTGNIICGLGESRVAEGGTYHLSKQELKHWIENTVASRKRAGEAFIAVTTNNEQRVANSVLLELGFSHSPWMTKERHPETKVRIWWKHLNS